MRYNYQLVVNMSTWNAFSGGSFSVNGSNSSTWAVNRHLKNQWERWNWTFRGCESGWVVVVVVVVVVVGGGGVGCLCGYHCFRPTPLFKTWHLQVMSVASQKLHRSRPFLRFKLIYLFLESTDKNRTHGLPVTYLEHHGTSILTPCSKYMATAYREEYCTASRSERWLARKSWMEPFRFKSCGVGIVTITESNSLVLSLRSVTNQSFALWLMFSGFSNLFIAVQWVS